MKTKKQKHTNEELLNWSMNQLYRAARAIQLLDLNNKMGSKIYVDGCDLVAETILKRLKETKVGLSLIKGTNPKLLKQKCPKHIKELMKEEE